MEVSFESLKIGERYLMISGGKNYLVKISKKDSDGLTITYDGIAYCFGKVSLKDGKLVMKTVKGEEVPVRFETVSYGGVCRLPDGSPAPGLYEDWKEVLETKKGGSRRRKTVRRKRFGRKRHSRRHI